MLKLEEMKDFVESQTTIDGRIAPDYAESFELKRVIDKLFEVAEQNESAVND